MVSVFDHSLVSQFKISIIVLETFFSGMGARYVMSCYVMLCRVMSCCVVSRRAYIDGDVNITILCQDQFCTLINTVQIILFKFRL